MKIKLIRTVVNLLRMMFKAFVSAIAIFVILIIKGIWKKLLLLWLIMNSGKLIKNDVIMISVLSPSVLFSSSSLSKESGRSCNDRWWLVIVNNEWQWSIMIWNDREKLLEVIDNLETVLQWSRMMFKWSSCCLRWCRFRHPHYQRNLEEVLMIDDA